MRAKSHPAPSVKGSGAGRIAAAFGATLGPVGYRLEREVPLDQVLDPGMLSGPWSAADRDRLASYRFDFLIRRPDGQIACAIEFDGPHHMNPGRSEMDARKNRVCWQNGVRILRLTKHHTLPRDGGVALVDFMFERHLAWIEWRRTDDATFAMDADDDPSHRFDLERTFPESRRKALHLWDEYRVLCGSLLPPPAWEVANSVREIAPMLCLDYAGSNDYEVAPLRRRVAIRRELTRWTPTAGGFTREVIRHFERETEYDFGLPAFDNPWSLAPAPVHFAELPPGVHERVIVWQDLGGVSSEEVARHYADYLVVTAAVKWARSHLPRVGALAC